MRGQHTKYIFVTGGVVSSLGKGLASASIGAILESRGLTVTFQKLDPYINVDPGTMNPFQHGEVYVTDDGAETDLDLGHYERYTSARTSTKNNFTTGRIYNNVISKERRGHYLGGTVQVIPHITDEIKSCIQAIGDDVDVAIIEVGGTVGDIESLPFLEAIRQFPYDVGRENVLYIHLTLVPFIKTADELKTKPTQHSVNKLREIGIQPDVLLCRTDRPIPDDMKKKIALFCNVTFDSVVTARDVESIYEVPLYLHEEGLDGRIIEKLGLQAGPAKLTEWERIASIIKKPKGHVKIALVGKYIELKESYKSLHEALVHGGIASEAKVDVVWLDAEDVERDGAARYLAEVDGILVPGGFGSRGIEGKIAAIRYAREQKIPFFGICLGMQCAVIEFARDVCGINGANSTEFDVNAQDPVIYLMTEWFDYRKNAVQTRSADSDLGGTMRLGAYPCTLLEGSRSAEAYGSREIFERHRHRYEFNNQYRERLAAAGLKFTGLSPDGQLVEIVELNDHPWFVACQFHPEFKSKPTNPHPLFVGFVKAAVETTIKV